MASLDELLKPMRGINRGLIQIPQDEWLLKTLDDTLSHDVSPMRSGVFYTSSLGSPCDRYLFNCFNGLVKDEPIAASTQRIFDCGDSLGLRYEEYFKKMRVLLQTEAPLKYDKPPISGRLDFLIKHELYGPTVIELKSINDKGFQSLEAPKPDHIVQLQIYLNVSGYQHGIVLYENKNTQEVKAFLMEKNVKHWEQIVDRCLNIMNMTSQPDACTGYRYCPCHREETE